MNPLPWIHSVSGVTFDLDIGQVTEWTVGTPLTKHEQLHISVLSFPETSTTATIDHIHSFRIIHHRSVPGAPPQSLYCFSYFHQERDPSIPRGYYQKALNIVTYYPFITFFTEVVSLAGLQYHTDRQPNGERILAESSAWPPFQSNLSASVTFFDRVLSLVIPHSFEIPSVFLGLSYKHPQIQLFSTHSRVRTSHRTASSPQVKSGNTSPQTTSLLTLDYQPIAPHVKDTLIKDLTSAVGASPLSPGHISLLQQTAPLSRPLHRFSSDIRFLWELVITGSPIVVHTPSPQLSSSIVNSLVALTFPLPYTSDFRPYYALIENEASNVRHSFSPLPHSDSRAQTLFEGAQAVATGSAPIFFPTAESFSSEPALFSQSSDQPTENEELSTSVESDSADPPSSPIQKELLQPSISPLPFLGQKAPRIIGTTNSLFLTMFKDCPTFIHAGSWAKSSPALHTSNPPHNQTDTPNQHDAPHSTDHSLDSSQGGQTRPASQRLSSSFSVVEQSNPLRSPKLSAQLSSSGSLSPRSSASTRPTPPSNSTLNASGLQHPEGIISKIKPLLPRDKNLAVALERELAYIRKLQDEDAHSAQRKEHIQQEIDQTYDKMTNLIREMVLELTLVFLVPLEAFFTVNIPKLHESPDHPLFSLPIDPFAPVGPLPVFSITSFSTFFLDNFHRFNFPQGFKRGNLLKLYEAFVKTPSFDAYLNIRSSLRKKEIQLMNLQGIALYDFSSEYLTKTFTTDEKWIDLYISLREVKRKWEQTLERQESHPSSILETSCAPWKTLEERIGWIETKMSSLLPFLPPDFRAVVELKTDSSPAPTSPSLPPDSQPSSSS
ncbi:putative Protein DENND6 like protein [Blattamonas nauphoetae]|uniref:UDENN domain-containing protein n=1 Tax=Blattamonas nauphoetae TaxID=2049346 RepID=A0ABQ9X1V8_9EUKA|nr:putative Protein DENND6 like protein [Blattamonas nauphoetae]